MLPDSSLPYAATRSGVPSSSRSALETEVGCSPAIAAGMSSAVSGSEGIDLTESLGPAVPSTVDSGCAADRDADSEESSLETRRTDVNATSDDPRTNRPTATETNRWRRGMGDPRCCLLRKTEMKYTNNTAEGGGANRLSRMSEPSATTGTSTLDCRGAGQPDGPRIARVSRMSTDPNPDSDPCASVRSFRSVALLFSPVVHWQPCPARIIE